MRIGARIGTGFVAALFVVVVICAISWRGANELVETVRQVDETNVILHLVDLTRADLIDVETGMRAYVVTGSDDFLEPYDRASGRLPADLAELHRLIADDPEQGRRVAVLTDAIARHQDSAARTVEARRDRGFEVAAAIVATRVGKTAMEEARALLDNIEREELRTLDERTAQARHGARQAFALILGSGLGMVLLVLLATLILSRSIVKPVRALARSASELGRTRQFESGELTRKDEIGDLARALDEMARHRAQAEARTRALIDDAPDAFLLADQDGRYIDANVAACALLGYRREELLARSITDLIPPEQTPRLAAIRAHLLEQRLTERSEWDLLAHDGERIPVEVSSRILPDGRWQAFVRDARERKRHKEAQREFEERFRLAFDEAPIGMALVRLDGRFLRVNAALSEIVGYPTEELVGLTFQEITHSDDLDADLTLVDRLVAGEISRYQLEKRYIRKDGSIVPILLSASIVRNAEGAPLYGVAQIEDITGRKQAQAERERILELERDHRCRLESIREASLAISALESGERRATDETVNEVLQSIVEEARRLTGADFGGLGIGTDASKPFDPWVASGVSAEEAERIGRQPRPIGALGFVAMRDVSLRLQHLHEHPSSIGLPANHPKMDVFLGVPIRRGGRSVGNLYLAKRPGGVPFSADDQAAVELLGSHAAIAIENARLYHQLHEALRAREEMLAVVSHDLKTPLSAIVLRSELLASQRDAPEVATHGASIRRAAAIMQQLIRRLLDVASLDAGTLRLELGDYDLAALGKDAVDVIQPVAAQRGIRVESNIAPGAWAVCDADRIAQVLSNLVGNAVKFTPEGGVVTVRAEPGPGELRISVTDSGLGIPAETRPHIFDRYFTTAQGQLGAGLGLYIVKGIIEAHGGRVWVESEPGRGTTVSFSLPERRIADRAQPPPA